MQFERWLMWLHFSVAFMKTITNIKYRKDINKEGIYNEMQEDLQPLSTLYIKKNLLFIQQEAR